MKPDLENETYLACPQCGDVWTHVDTVVMHAAGGQTVSLTADGEDAGATVSTLPSSPPGVDDPVDVGRRHTIVLTIDCEECGGLSLLHLRQHKGQTEVFVERGTPRFYNHST